MLRKVRTDRALSCSYKAHKNLLTVRRSRKFESCHLDHKEKTVLVAVFSLWLCVVFSPWLLPCNNAGSVSPPGDRRACTAGAGRGNFRRRRIPCHPTWRETAQPQAGKLEERRALLRWRRLAAKAFLPTRCIHPVDGYLSPRPNKDYSFDTITRL